MSTGRGDDTIVSLQDVVEEDQQLEQTANAVLGDSDDTQCTYPKGYVYHQALYACGTCSSGDGGDQQLEPGGVCLACSLHCHDGHALYELYTKRHFRCDCGNSKFPSLTCSLCPDKDQTNPENKYNHNFRGDYCTCNRPYPDSEDEVEDEMIQCCICEDWFHSRHLGGEVPDSYEEMSCDSCMKSHDFLHLSKQRGNPVKVSKEATTDSNTPQPTPTEVNVTESEPRNGNRESKNATSESKNGESNILSLETATTSTTSSADNGTNKKQKCELERRKTLLSTTFSACPSSETAISDSSGAGFFGEGWRSRLCHCDSCKELYTSSGVGFLLEESDPVGVYEGKAERRPTTLDAGMAALSSSLDRVQQVEALHQYNELKSDLSEFLKGFAQQGNSIKVVSKRDIDDFFEEMQARKRRRVELGEGIPPQNCHF